MPTFRTLAAGLLLAVAPAPLLAGELWIDYLEQRFPICPAAADENAMLDERAGDFLIDMVYELDKEIAPEEPELSLTRNAVGQRSASFDVTRQMQLRERLDRMETSLILLLPAVETSGQPLSPGGLHAPLRAAFAKMLNRTPLDDDGTEETLGSVLNEFLAAKANAEILLPYSDLKSGASPESDDLLAALENMESAYRNVRPALMELVGRDDFPALLEIQLWAECLGGAERKDG